MGLFLKVNGNGFKLIKNKKENELIYEIVGTINGVKKWYIGKTCGTEIKRLNEHLNDPNSSCYKMPDATIKIIGNVLCDLKKLRDFENDYITHCKDLHGDDCVNKINFVVKVNPTINELHEDGWEIVDNVNIGKVYEYNDKRIFKLRWVDILLVIKWRRNGVLLKKGRDVVLEEAKKWCIENDVKLNF